MKRRVYQHSELVASQYAVKIWNREMYLLAPQYKKPRTRDAKDRKGFDKKNIRKNKNYYRYIKRLHNLEIEKSKETKE